MTTTTLALEPSGPVSIASLRAFYAQPLARRTLIATSVLLTYVAAARCSGCTPSTGASGAQPSTTGSTGCWTPRSASSP